LDEVKTLVLVVDDEPGILRFVKASLLAAGFDAIATTDGREALEVARTGDPDIMVLDIYMQPISGFDVLKELRTFSHLPVIIITARQEAAKKAVDEGANGYVLKPFRPDQLVQKIRDVMDEILGPD
jgi:two-component system KDP operon response regulator KdpE